MKALGDKSMAQFKYVGGKDAPDSVTIFGMSCNKGDVIDVRRQRQIEVLDAIGGFERADGRTKAAKAAKARTEDAGPE